MRSRISSTLIFTTSTYVAGCKTCAILALLCDRFGAAVLAVLAGRNQPQVTLVPPPPAPDAVRVFLSPQESPRIVPVP